MALRLCLVAGAFAVHFAILWSANASNLQCFWGESAEKKVDGAIYYEEGRPPGAPTRLENLGDQTRKISHL